MRAPLTRQCGSSIIPATARRRIRRGQPVTTLTSPIMPMTRDDPLASGTVSFHINNAGRCSHSERPRSRREPSRVGQVRQEHVELAASHGRIGRRHADTELLERQATLGTRGAELLNCMFALGVRRPHGQPTAGGLDRADGSGHVARLKGAGGRLQGQIGSRRPVPRSPGGTADEQRR